MVENLINLFTELCQETVRQALEIDDDEYESKKKNGSLNKYVKKLRGKCLDIVLQNNPELDYSDPCKTSYGADWNPLTLILDYGGELAYYGAEKASKRLTANIRKLQGRDYVHIQDMYKLIFLLRGSYSELGEELQPEFLTTVSDYSLKSQYPTSDIYADIYGLAESNTLSSQGPYKKYSKTLFESGCQLLTKLSNRKIPSEKGKHRILSASASKILNPSRSLDSSDFILKQKSYSNSSFIQVASNLYSSNHSLWDNFVEKPITFKFKPTPKFKSSCLTTNSGGSGEHFKNGYKVHETESTTVLRKPNNYWTGICDIREVFKFETDDKENLKEPNIDMYPILKENTLKLENYESCFDRKVKSRDKSSKENVRNSFFQCSETLILALWEQDLKFMITYNPELISSIREMRILELEQFLRDVQFLLIGIATDTFKINEEALYFTMEDYTCLEGVTPNTLLNFAKEYLEIGSCYIKLSHHTRLNLKKQMNYTSKSCRIIFKVFWMSIFDYLCRHSQYVLKVPVNLGLLEFKSCVKNLHPIITSVAEICKVHEEDSILPQGGQLLSYILQATQKINNKYASGVLFGFLKACCETYLAQLLQEWLFQGHLDRHHDDFFVEHRPKNPRCKDRSYYLSFFKFHERIPCFLKGLENNIFNCGKTIHLLKLIQPDSKLCRLLETRTYPKMKLCLSDRELKEQSREFEHYSENVARICGQFVSIAFLKLEEITREQNYEKYIMEVKKEQELQRAQLKKESREELKRKREEQNQWLNKQIQLAAEEKKKKREQEEKESLRFMDQVRHIAEEERRIVEEEKRNIKMFYEELMDEIDQRNAGALTWKQMNKKNALMRNCKSDDEICINRNSPTPTKVPLFSLLDGDKIVDREGNIVSCEVLFTKPELDIVNSNLESVETRLEDIANENVVISDESEAQLQKLIDSRKKYENRAETETVTESKGKESPSRNFDSPKGKGQRQKSPDPKQSPRSVKANPHKNKQKIVESPMRTAGRTKIPVMITEVQKNKKKMMSCEFGIGEEKVQTKKSVSSRASTESEAEKNKRKVMESEYGSCLKKGNTKEMGETIQKTKIETESEKNKKKVMGTEYGMKIKNERKIVKKPIVPETEAQKNKRKVMASEFALPLDHEVQKLEKKPVEETEAQRNKRKVLGTEFGISSLPEIKRNACSAEALKNKKRFLEIEYGYPKENTVEKKQEEDTKELKTSAPMEGSRSDDLTEEEYLDCYLNPEFTKQSSLAEKALDIFNKRKSTKDDLGFFILKENTSDGSFLPNSYPWLNYSEVQVLFDQHLRRPMINTDPISVAAGFAGMDATTFLNYTRRSVLIPLKVQESIANEALFNHLLKMENMLSHFNALRNYYFLNDGEFSRRLTQNMFATLAQCTEPHQFFKRSTMNEIVYEALNYTIHSSEPYTQNVSFEIVHMPSFLSHASHDVLSPFELSYQVKWPLNIIITEKALSKYKLVFHFLLKLKRINWTLNENFSYLTYSFKDKNVKSRLLINSPHYHKIHIYRHAIGQFMRTLENYMSSCSLQFPWFNFQKDLESAKNLDHLYEKHVRYIKEVLKRCFLTKESHELLTCINNLIELSLKFHYATKSGRWLLADGKYEHTKFGILKTTFTDFCNLTTDFLKTLRKKINHHHDLKPHEVLIEKFDMILR